jgi:hypothetical protein
MHHRIDSPKGRKRLLVPQVLPQRWDTYAGELQYDN